MPFYSRKAYKATREQISWKFVIRITDKILGTDFVTDTHLPTQLEMLGNTVPVTASQNSSQKS